MSADDDDSSTAPDSEASSPGAGTVDPVPCSACRGTGEVISNLGGTPQRVPCPWCDGGGIRLTGHDAQAAQVALREAGGDTPVADQQAGDDEGQAGADEPDAGAGDGEPPDQVA
jgi:DnaJ-class molecular chaperone